MRARRDGSRGMGTGSAANGGGSVGNGYKMATFPGQPEIIKRRGPPQLVVVAALSSTGDLGFEPRLTDPESVVLPLHQSPESDVE